MEIIILSTIVVGVILEVVIASIPWEFNHHINNNWQQLHKNKDLSLERMFLHHGRVISDVIIEGKRFLGEFLHENDTNIIVSCELEIS